MPHSLHTCPCGGFVPEAAAACPHCDAPRRTPRRLARVLASMAGAGAFAITLMACYGAMPQHGAYAEQPGCNDGDGDNVCVPQDCNDADPTIVPGGPDEDGDGIDQNCDGVDGWRDPDVVAEPVEPAPT